MKKIMTYKISLPPWEEKWYNIYMKAKTSISLTLFIGVILITAIFVSAKRLDVPFTPQAPDKIWKKPWSVSCEESSIAMIDLFYSGYPHETIDRELAKDRILKLVSIENNFLGFNDDSNAEQIAVIINNFMPWEAKIVENPTLEMMKAEIDGGRPIIIPTHISELENKYYDSSKLDYHVFLIHGYDDEKQEFIAHDAGTHYGKDYRYGYSAIMKAIHDLVPGKSETGRKVLVFTSPVVNESGDLDGDNDGLTKRDELLYGTVLYLADSDGDSYLDGVEVKNGYSPTLNEMALAEGALIKTANSDEVYLINGGEKHHIVSEGIFTARGWIWSQIKEVSEKFINRLDIGYSIK